jgi:hypothetical protein
MNIISRFFLNLLRFFLSFAFVLSLSSFIIIWTLADFSQESNVKPLIADIFHQSLKKQLDAFTEEEIKTSISMLCANKENIETTIGGVDVKISCKDFYLSKDLTRFVAESIASSIYNTEYNCEVIECLNYGRYDVLISRKGNQFYSETLLPLILASSLFGLAFFVLEEGKIFKRIRSVAVLILLVCLPALMINFLIDPIKKRFISHSDMVDKIAENLLEIAFKKYLVLLIVGASLLVISIVAWIIERRQGEIPFK